SGAVWGSGVVDRHLVLVAHPDHELDTRDRGLCGVAKPDVVNRVSTRALRERPVALHRRQGTNGLPAFVRPIELDSFFTGSPTADDGRERSRAIIGGLETVPGRVREPNAHGGCHDLHRHWIPVHRERGALHGIAVDAVYGLSRLVAPGRPVRSRGH